MALVKWYEIFFDPLTESEEYKRAEESRTSDIELEAEGDEIDLSSTNPLNQDLPVSGVVTNLIINSVWNNLEKDEFYLVQIYWF